MALWGNNDSKNTKGTDGGVGLVTNFNYNGTAHGYGKLTLFGSNTQWGETVHADEGDVIRIGRRGAGINKYFGDVVVVSVATTERCTVASSESLVGTAVTSLAQILSSLEHHLLYLRCLFGAHKTFREIDLETSILQELQLLHLIVTLLSTVLVQIHLVQTL